MSLISSGNRAFRAVADVLNFPGSAALTKIDINAAVPSFDVQGAIEAGVVRQIVLMRASVVGAGVITTNLTLDVHTAADWGEAFVGGQLGTVADVIPGPREDVWVTGIGAHSTAFANFTSMFFFRRQVSGALGAGEMPLWFGDTSVGAANVVVARNATHDSPILLPLPWWFPAPTVSSFDLHGEILTSNANTTVITCSLLAAREGVFKRLYG